MLRSILATSLLLLTLSAAAAYACGTGNPNSLAYIRRDGNRCEGISDRPVSTSDTFDLVSFSTTNLTAYPSTLAIRVPDIGITPPRLIIQSYHRNYRLDNLTIPQGRNGINFSLPTRVLQNTGVPIASLLATASINLDGQATYLPVILGQASGRYVFVIKSPRRISFPTIEIRHSGSVVFRNSITTPTTGQIPISWAYGNTPAGVYELYIVDGEGNQRLFRFQHNRSWF